MLHASKDARLGVDLKFAQIRQKVCSMPSSALNSRWHHLEERCEASRRNVVTVSIGRLYAPEMQ